MVKVYMVERGCYSDRHVASVHSSVEKAMAHYPGETWRPLEYCEGWQNTKDWGDLLEISVFELDEEQPEPTPFETMLVASQMDVPTLIEVIIPLQGEAR